MFPSHRLDFRSMSIAIVVSGWVLPALRVKTCTGTFVNVNINTYIYLQSILSAIKIKCEKRIRLGSGFLKVTNRNTP